MGYSFFGSAIVSIIVRRDDIVEGAMRADESVADYLRRVRLEHKGEDNFAVYDIAKGQADDDTFCIIDGEEDDSSSSSSDDDDQEPPSKRATTKKYRRNVALLVWRRELQGQRELYRRCPIAHERARATLSPQARHGSVIRNAYGIGRVGLRNMFTA